MGEAGAKEKEEMQRPWSGPPAGRFRLNPRSSEKFEASYFCYFLWSILVSLLSQNPCPLCWNCGIFNHWTAREVPLLPSLDCLPFCHARSYQSFPHYALINPVPQFSLSGSPHRLWLVKSRQTELAQCTWIQLQTSTCTVGYDMTRLQYWKKSVTHITTELKKRNIDRDLVPILEQKMKS